ncbi:MAG: retropepsin-like aspartic protease [Gammaproteobacteria bacterium]
MMLKVALIFLSLGLGLPVVANQNTIDLQNTTSLAMHKNGAATFYLKGQLGDLAAADFMLDTGSGYLVINQESLAQLQASGQAQYVKDIRGILANGDKLVVPVWRITKLTLGKQCVLRNVEAAIFPGKTRQILGLSALSKAAPFSVSFDPPQIVLSNCTQAS